MNKSESKYFNTATKIDLALISLLKQKPLDYITVSEICKTAGVNRSTFYLHYETIGDLLSETTRYLLDQFMSYFSQDIQSTDINIMTCELDSLVFICDKYLVPYLTYVKDNKEVFKTALSYITLFGFEDVYARLFDQIFNPILERFHYPPEYRGYAMKYYLNGIIAIINEWLNDDCNKPIEELSAIISACVFGLKRE